MLHLMLCGIYFQSTLFKKYLEKKKNTCALYSILFFAVSKSCHASDILDCFTVFMCSYGKLLF